MWNLLPIAPKRPTRWCASYLVVGGGRFWNLSFSLEGNCGMPLTTVNLESSLKWSLNFHEVYISSFGTLVSYQGLLLLVISYLPGPISMMSLMYFISMTVCEKSRHSRYFWTISCLSVGALIVLRQNVNQY